MYKDKNKARRKVEGLIGKYSQVVEENRVKKYNEEMTKKDFIQPLFYALGWNVEDSTEVSAEEKISKKRVDYGFRIEGIPKFFLEAKSLKADLENPEFFEQAISYAWHKGCIWAVLTNFESVNILNAEWKAGSHIQSHFTTIHANEFLSRFDELWLLSKAGFEQGLLDKEAEKRGKKTRRVSIDRQLLEDFTRFREKLSKSIARLNQDKDITKEDLDESVQRILDRLIFIRNCEDRELEPRILISTLRQWESKGKGRLVERLREVFSQFNERYNGRVFTEHLCDSLEIGDGILYEIVMDLYHTKYRFFSLSYDFSAIDADVLGNIYEQYLSHILKKTEKRATLKKNHMHRKEQGIYYTPTHIVDYIVRNTLGELLKQEEVDASKIRVLDPACGSGSFLIKAFDVLNEYYMKHYRDYSQTQLDLTTGLPFTKRVEILQKNIFGVDLDRQAVEIAQLNLLLKIAEKGRRLPLLEQNIKRGDSLIDDEKVAGDKAFKWEDEFGKIIDGEGGFDVVIGNPPYVNMQTLPELQNWCESRYPEIYTGQNDILYYFVLRGLSVLKHGGKLGFIVSRYFLESSYASKFRRYILENCAIDTIIDFNNYQVFGKEVNVLTSIILFVKADMTERQENIVKVIKVKDWSKTGSELISYILENKEKRRYSDEYVDIFEVSQNGLTEERWTLSNPEVAKIKRKMRENSKLLREICDIGQGMTTGLNEAFVLDAKTATGENIEHGVLRNYIKTRDLKRYTPLRRNLKIIYIPEKTEEERIKNTLKHLRKWQTELRRRFSYRKGNCEWYSWANLRNRELYERDTEKVITPLYSTSNKFVYDSGKTNQNYYTLTDTFIIVPKERCEINLKYILAILNSKLNEFYIKNTAKLKREGYFEYSKGTLSGIPIRHDKKFAGELIRLVNNILSFKSLLNEIGEKKIDERVRLEEETSKNEAQVDELVYSLYGIDETERRIIEDSID